VHAVVSIYPEFDWVIWKFNIILHGFLQDKKNHMEYFPKGFWNNYNGEYDDRFLNNIGNRLHICNLHEWYRVSKKDLSNAGAVGFVKKRGGLLKLLQEEYPHYNWKVENFSGKPKRSCQWWLCKTLQEIFPPGTDILEEYQLPSIIHTGYILTFDICAPSLNIIFEYQGYQHFYDHYLFGDVKTQKEQDKTKRDACMYHNITYLEVPYWWQRDKESIVAIVHHIRPDIIPHALGSPFHYPQE